MFTDQRLSSVYKRSKTKYIDKHSKYVFFSDLHRGDDSVSDEFARNQSLFLYAINYYYHHNFHYVEVGDGDELWEHPRFKHIRSAHSDIFTTLQKFYRKKRMTLIYGNHNINFRNSTYVKNNLFYFYDEYNEKIMPLFKHIIPCEAIKLKHKYTGQEILVLHGHQGDLMNDQLWFLSMIWLRYFWRFMHLIGFQNPSSPAKNMYKRHKIERAFNQWILSNQTMIICGHTHRSKFPRQGEPPYFNAGCCIHTKGITAIELENDQITLVRWRIRANKKGELVMERFIMGGPKHLSSFRF